MVSICALQFCVHADKRKMLNDLTASLQSKPSKHNALRELTACISSAINADGENLYVTQGENLELYRDENRT